MPDRTCVALFTEEEVRAALLLLGTADSASAVAAELYSLPQEEQANLNWIDTTLLLLSCVSEDLARRVLEHFGTTPTSRARLEADQRKFREWISGLDRRAERSALHLADVVHDARQHTAFMRDIRGKSPDAGSGNCIGLFSEAEVRAALSLYGDPATAASVAAQVYALQPARQAELVWTDTALWLLSCVSEDLAERVAANFGDTAERMEHIREMQQLFRELVEGGEFSGRDVDLSMDTVVREYHV